jgi:23S rRNA pseudouridine1911/1915/1917 synthase
MPALSVQPNQRVTFRVEYEDDDLAVVSKRAGLVTQPGLGHESDSLLNGLFARWGAALQRLGRARDYGLLHRLDRETSGLLVVGLSARAYDALREAFEQRRMKKFYWAVCARAPRVPSGLIQKPLAERVATGPGKKLARITRTGKPAVTAYRTLHAGPHAALLEVRPLTGRLHQVRVHLESIGCPILGDGLYAPRAVADAAPRLMLHAHRLAFEHPLTGAPVDVRTRFPQDLRATMRRLELPLPAIDTTPGAPTDPEHR